jgi:hypothetical protein
MRFRAPESKFFANIDVMFAYIYTNIKNIFLRNI